MLVIGVAVLGFAYKGGESHAASGYDVIARFNHAEGISIGSEVRFAGMPVGSVTGQKLDVHYRAVLTLRLSPSVELPDDSAALIETDGLLGAKFVALQPGSNESNLKPGDEISLTQDSMNLTDLLDLIIAQGKNARAKGRPGPAAKKQ